MAACGLSGVVDRLELYSNKAACKGGKTCSRQVKKNTHLSGRQQSGIRAGSRAAIMKKKEGMTQKAFISWALWQISRQQS